MASTGHVRDLIIGALMWAELRQHLLQGSSDTARDEQLAFILAAPNETMSGVRLIARELILARSQDLDHQSPGGIRPTADFVARALTRCNQDGWSLVEVHSHPFDSGSRTTFSGIDWNNDQLKMPQLTSMFPEPFHHATMVIGQQGLDAHYYVRETETIEPLRQVVIVGIGSETEHPLTCIRPTSARSEDRVRQIESRHQRQLPIIGSDVHKKLSEKAIAVVGLGGLGSFVAFELAYLGAGQIILVDHDDVEETNLNRLLGATPSDVGKPKVDVLAARLADVSPTAEIIALAKPLMDIEAQRLAKSADILVGCVDNHGARLVMNHLALRYLIPLVDAGTGADLNSSQARIGGQVQLIVPGAGCLECRGFIDPSQAAFDLASPEFQEYEIAHGYGTEEAAPSVIFLNGVVASLQVSEVVALLDPVSGTVPHDMVMYDAVGQAVFTVASRDLDGCAACSYEDGVLGMGDLAPLGLASNAPAPPID